MIVLTWIMIVIKCVLLWLLIGLLFNVVVEGFPEPKRKLTRVQKRIMIWDVCMGPIAWIWFIGLKIKKEL